MNFVDAVKTCFTKYADLNGCAPPGKTPNRFASPRTIWPCCAAAPWQP